MIVSVIQAEQYWEDKQKNLDNYNSLVEQISETDLIILPEMFHTGFSMNAESLAENMEGNALQWLRATSKQKKTAIYTSFICIENGKYFNRGVFVYPDGNYITYDKRQCFGLAGEDKIYTPGNKEVIVEYLGWKIQLQICYDLRFPEIVRNRIESDGHAAYDLILYVANWPSKRSHHWKSLLVSRAIENQCYVVGVNRVGIDGNHFPYSGDSACVDALGTASVFKSPNQSIQSFVISLDVLNEIRENLPFLKDITL